MEDLLSFLRPMIPSTVESLQKGLNPTGLAGDCSWKHLQGELGLPSDHIQVAGIQTYIITEIVDNVQ
jgi:hypothetical protein